MKIRLSICRETRSLNQDPFAMGTIYHCNDCHTVLFGRKPLNHQCDNSAENVVTIEPTNQTG